ncbi:hypothetical protein HanRHA438_Chr08g0354531 [Helianthus annuus]|nr:hypothetical protein HanRHA438_Chr08g0354531 [Helianthus annuus]
MKTQWLFLGGFKTQKRQLSHHIEEIRWTCNSYVSKKTPYKKVSANTPSISTATCYQGNMAQPHNHHYLYLSWMTNKPPISIVSFRENKAKAQTTS